jgi:hypothetical protein
LPNFLAFDFDYHDGSWRTVQPFDWPILIELKVQQKEF